MGNNPCSTMTLEGNADSPEGSTPCIIALNKDPRKAMVRIFHQLFL
jgi:hypothetical protein